MTKRRAICWTDTEQRHRYQETPVWKDSHFYFHFNKELHKPFEDKNYTRLHKSTELLTQCIRNKTKKELKWDAALI